MPVLSRVEGTPKIDHRDTEVTEPAFNSPTRMVLISFSVLSVSPWWRFVRNKPNFHQRADREIGVPGGNRAKQTQFVPGQNQSQVQCSKEVRSDSSQHGHGKNKANGRILRAFPLPTSHLTLRRSRRAKQTQLAGCGNGC